MWIREPDVAYAFPNDDGVTLMTCVPFKDKLPEFKRDIEGSFVRFFDGLPDAPRLEEGQRVSEILGILDVPNVSRSVSESGLALIGDAALVSDPVWGVGCGWAFESAEWLVDATAGTLLADGNLDDALKQYRRCHRSRLAAHHFLIADFSGRRAYNLIERIMFSAAAKDQVAANHLAAFGSRCSSVPQFLSPRAIARALWVNATGRGQ